MVRKYSGFRWSKFTSIPTDTSVTGQYETYPDTGITVTDASGNPVPKKVTAESFETCVKNDGTPVELRLNMDIVYPATVKDAPVVMISSSSEEKMGVCTSSERALDELALLNGCAVAVYEHAYVPMAREDHYGYFSPGFSLNNYVAIDAHSAAARCVRYFSQLYGYDTENYGAMGHSKGSPVAVLANPTPEKIDEASQYSGFVDMGTYGEQPFLSYTEGTPIPSNVDIVYASMGPGINQYYDLFISEGGAAMILACGLFDTDVQDSWSWWTYGGKSSAGRTVGPITEAFEEVGVPFVAMTELDLEHDYPYMVDPYYNYDRYMAFVDTMMYHIKDGMSSRIVYSSIVDSRVVDRGFDATGDGAADKAITITKPDMSTLLDGRKLDDSILGNVTGDIDAKVVGSITVTGRSVKRPTGTATLTRGTDLYIQFLAPMTEDSVNAHMYLKDASGNRVSGELKGTAGGTKWEFVPAVALTDGATYTLVVEAGIIDVKNAIPTTDGAAYTFTWGK